MAEYSPEQLVDFCRDVISPVIELDGGELYLVRCEAGSLELHLGGRCGGCPGRTVAVEQIIEPAVRSIAPNVQLRVTYGALMPDGATLLSSVEDSPEQTTPRGDG